jgi:putative Holliday junction resolvase
MAFDFGTRRIGVAVANTGIGVAHGIATVQAESRAEQFAAIEPLVKEWQPMQFVIGEPRHENGEPHEVAHLAKKFGNRMHERFGIPVAYIEETLSSSEASARLAERGIHGRDQKQHLDAMAAQVILQSWLDEQQRPQHAQ